MLGKFRVIRVENNDVMVSGIPEPSHLPPIILTRQGEKLLYLSPPSQIHTYKCRWHRLFGTLQILAI